MGVEAAFLQKLFLQATELVRARLQSFDPQELRLYSKTLSKFAASFAETPSSLTSKKAFLHGLHKELLNAAKFPKSHSLMFLQRVSNLSLAAFGSSVMGTGMRNGDLDISLLGHYQPRHSKQMLPLNAVKKKELQSCVLYDVLKFLRDRNRLRMATPAFVVSRAKIPILKYTDRLHGFPCDISVGNSNGVIRSRVLGEIIQQDERIRDLILLVKKWAKAHDLNDASKGSFGSYSLTVMVLSFCSAQGLLPSLDLLLDGPLESDLEKRCRQLKERIKKERKQVQMPLVELAVSCFAFLSLFCSREALYSGQSPHLAVGGKEGLVREISQSGIKSGVFVSDPFDPESNCAKPVSPASLQKASMQLELHFSQISEFLSCPRSKRRKKWQSLFHSLFKARIHFTSQKKAIQPSTPSEPLPPAEDPLLQLHDELIKHYFQRDAKGIFKVHRDAHGPLFLEKFDAYLQTHKPSKESAGTEQDSLFSIKESSVAVPGA